LIEGDKMSVTAKASISLVIVHLLGFLVMLALGNGQTAGPLSISLWMFLGIYGIQWLAFIPAYLTQSERFFDLTGSLTYILAVLFALVLTATWQWQQVLVASLVIVWAARLGSFLFRRIQRDGKDGRFDDIKPNFMRFLNVWSIQGLWVSLTSAAAVALILSEPEGFSWFVAIGALVWLAGFVFEVTADNQKSAFRKDPANKEKFISEGLWSISRHPNYVGEITLWIGVALMAVPFLSGWQWVAMISPVFVFLLLRFVSGVPMLEKRADAKWGDDPAYQAYKANTPMLFPGLSSNSQATVAAEK
jgi:steroid 5-alpha reductase family enzyme